MNVIIEHAKEACEHVQEIIQLVKDMDKVIVQAGSRTLEFTCRRCDKTFIIERGAA
jgi:hypothetical protein